ncbi:MAG TPA: YceI family protein, partial [Chitinophagales bacterium]|nr:YceI family protein [Chitinophagales bacterium]
MQEHFNENYVESDKFPKSTFKGSITNLSDINFSQDGSYDANVSGSLTLHGVTQAISTSGKIIITNGQPQVECTFTILLSDYGISIPAVVKNNISNIIGISIIAPLQLQQAIE